MKQLFFSSPSFREQRLVQKMEHTPEFFEQKQTAEVVDKIKTSEDFRNIVEEKSHKLQDWLKNTLNESKYKNSILLDAQVKIHTKARELIEEVAEQYIQKESYKNSQEEIVTSITSKKLQTLSQEAFNDTKSNYESFFYTNAEGNEQFNYAQFLEPIRENLKRPLTSFVGNFRLFVEKPQLRAQVEKILSEQELQNFETLIEASTYGVKMTDLSKQQITTISKLAYSEKRDFDRSAIGQELFGKDWEKMKVDYLSIFYAMKIQAQHVIERFTKEQLPLIGDPNDQKDAKTIAKIFEKQKAKVLNKKEHETWVDYALHDTIPFLAQAGLVVGGGLGSAITIASSWRNGEFLKKPSFWVNSGAVLVAGMSIANKGLFNMIENFSKTTQEKLYTFWKDIQHNEDVVKTLQNSSGQKIISLHKAVLKHSKKRKIQQYISTNYKQGKPTSLQELQNIGMKEFPDGMENVSGIQITKLMWHLHKNKITSNESIEALTQQISPNSQPSTSFESYTSLPNTYGEVTTALLASNNVPQALTRLSEKGIYAAFEVESPFWNDPLLTPQQKGEIAVNIAKKHIHNESIVEASINFLRDFPQINIKTFKTFLQDLQTQPLLPENKKYVQEILKKC